MYFSWETPVADWFFYTECDERWAKMLPPLVTFQLFPPYSALRCASVVQKCYQGSLVFVVCCSHWTLRSGIPRSICLWGYQLGLVGNSQWNSLGNHKIIELFDSEMGLEDHGQGCLPLAQVAQSPIQPQLEHLQGCGNCPQLIHLHHTKGVPKTTILATFHMVLQWFKWQN